MSSESRSAKIVLGRGLRCDVEIRGHRIIADEPVDKGGGDEGPTPMEIFLGGLGACTAMTLRMYANVKNWPVESVEVELEHAWVTREEWPDWPEGEERTKIPRILRRIRIGGDLDEAQMERLHHIANRCPVHRTVTENPVVVDEILKA